MKNYEILTGTLVSVDAESEAEAMELIADGRYMELETVSELKAVRNASNMDMPKRCTCEQPDAPGWHINDDAGITFGTLKNAQNEAADDMAQWIANVYFKKDNQTFNKLMEQIVDRLNEGQKFGSYSTKCEWEV